MRHYSLSEKLMFIKESLEYVDIDAAAKSLNVSKSSLYKWAEKYANYVTDPKYKTIADAADAIRKVEEEESSVDRKIEKKLQNLPEKLIGATFVDKIKYLYKTAGLTSQDLQKITDVKAGTINLMLRTLSVPRKSTVKKFIDAFDYPAKQWRSPIYEDKEEVKHDDQESLQREEIKPIADPNPVQIATTDYDEQIKELKQEIQDISARMTSLLDSQVALMKTITSCMQTQQNMLQFQQTQRIYNPNYKKQPQHLNGEKLGDYFPKVDGNK